MRLSATEKKAPILQRQDGRLEMRGVNRARQVLTRERNQFTVPLNRTATLLAFRPGAAIAAALTPVAATPAAPAPPALSAVLAFASWLAAIFAPLRRLVVARGWLVAGAAIVAAVPTLSAGAAASATAALSALALIMVAPELPTSASSGQRRRGLVRFPAKNSLQPSDNSAGFLRRFDIGRAVRVGLVGTRFSPAIVTAGLGTALVARIASTFTGLPRFARFIRPAAFPTFTTVA
jgi:hypothetical protein